MRVYVVTRNDEPYRATFSEQEACETFDGLVGGPGFEQAAVIELPTSEAISRVLMAAYREPQQAEA